MTPKFIAFRFMLKGTEKGTFSAMTLFAWLAIGVGVAAMGCLLSVMYGFESALKDRVLKAYPHVIIKGRTSKERIFDYEPWQDKFSKLPRVERVIPVLESEMIVQSSERALGGVIRGLRAQDFPSLANEMQGRIPSPASKLPEVVMGSELASRLHLSEGSRLKIISPTATMGPMGMVPESSTFEVSGIYQSGHYDFDQQYLFLLLEDAQDLMRAGASITGWHLWGDKVENADNLRKEAAHILSLNLEAMSFSDFNAALFHSLRLEQFGMFVLLTFAIVIAAMNIVITLMMHVTQKKRNIGILRALGASRTQVRKIFLWQGLYLGMVGLCLGALLTAGFVVYIRFFSSYQLPDIYYDRTVPIELRPLSLGVIYGVASVLIYLATLYPSLRAASVDPIEAIRE